MSTGYFLIFENFFVSIRKTGANFGLAWAHDVCSRICSIFSLPG